MAFVFGNRDELVNLDHVTRIRPAPPRDGSGQVILDLADGEIYAPANIVETIVQIIPVSGQWDALVLIDDPDLSYVVDPVIAWGIPLDGGIAAITASCPDGIHKQGNAHVLRCRDKPTVYAPYLGTFPCADDWLKEETASRQRQAEIRAGKKPQANG